MLLLKSERIQKGDIELRGEMSAKDYKITTEVEIKPEDDEEEYGDYEIQDVHNQIKVFETVKEEHVKGKMRNCLKKHIEFHFGSSKLDSSNKYCKYVSSTLENGNGTVNVMNKIKNKISEDKNPNFESMTLKTKEKRSSRSKINLNKKDNSSQHNGKKEKCEGRQKCGKYSKLYTQNDEYHFDINILKSNDNINNFRLEIDLAEDTDDLKHIQKEENSKKEGHKEKDETEENKENASDEAKLKKGRYNCTICSKTFSFKGNRARHMRQFHENTDKSYVCDCGKVFKNRRYYQSHSKFYCNNVERETMSYLCHLCSRSFKNSDYLRKHLKVIHEGIKLNIAKEQLICDYCQQKYRYKFNLMRHILQTHMGNAKRPFVCDYCEKTFKRSSTLNKHLFTHETEKQFKCKKCFKKFKSRWGWLNHQKNLCLF